MATLLWVRLPAAAAPLTLVTEEFAPYSYRDHGKVSGYATEVLEAALTHAGLAYSVQIYPWARALQMAGTRPNVLIYSIGANRGDVV